MKAMNRILYNIYFTKKKKKKRKHKRKSECQVSTPPLATLSLALNSTFYNIYLRLARE